MRRHTLAGIGGCERDLRALNDLWLTGLDEIERTRHSSAVLAGMSMQWLLIFKAVILLIVANGAPVIATKLFRKFLNQPLDRGASFVDGRQISGRFENVTWDRTFTCGHNGLCADTRVRVDIRSHHSERRHDWRSNVKLFEAATRLSTEQPCDRN